MTRRLRWGLLSTARINRSLIPALRKSPRSELRAVASRSARTAQEYARSWGIPRAIDGYPALLADPEIDVVYNPLPNSLHAEWTVRAAEAGKHVLCEKPMAISLDQVDAVEAAAEGAGVVVAEAFMYRHHPQTRKVIELVRGGAIGRLRRIRGAFTFNLSREGDVRLVPELGGGSLWDVGCYPVSYARLVAGSAPVEAFGWAVVGPTGVDLSFSGQLRFGDGVAAQFDCGFDAPFRTSVEIVGSEGTLLVPQAFKPSAAAVLLLRRGDDTQAVPVAADDLYLYEVEDLAAAVLDGTPPTVSLADSRANVATLLALLESAREGRPVAVNPHRT
jgi:xylose dehydrogenase (NAD/NADP)